MATRRHTRESIAQTLQNVAARKGKTVLSKQEVAAHIPISSVKYHFGSLAKALDAAGLGVAGRDPSTYDRMRLSDDELFTSLWDVEQKIGREPHFSQYRANGGRFSDVPFRKRFGKWPVTLQYYRKWKTERGGLPAVPGKPSTSSDTSDERVVCAAAPFFDEQPQSRVGGRSQRAPQLFGEPIEFRGLRHAPINEQGVVYLFGMVSRELGFSVEALQQGFPDCEGKYLHDKNRKLWAKARIEFEFRASNFREHGHDENECDVIVCWENDWPDCPLRVVELKSEIMRLPSR
jgi:hypothetical protein